MCTSHIHILSPQKIFSQLLIKRECFISKILSEGKNHFYSCEGKTFFYLKNVTNFSKSFVDMQIVTQVTIDCYVCYKEY